VEDRGPSSILVDCLEDVCWLLPTFFDPITALSWFFLWFHLLSPMGEHSTFTSRFSLFGTSRDLTLTSGIPFPGGGRFCCPFLTTTTFPISPWTLPCLPPLFPTALFPSFVVPLRGYGCLCGRPLNRRAAWRVARRFGGCGRNSANIHRAFGPG